MLAHEERVAREDDVRRQDGPPKAACDVPSVALVDVDAQPRREAREFVRPVREKRQGRENQDGRGVRSGRGRRRTGRQDPGNGLNRLSEAHVIREERPKAVFRHEPNPRDAVALIAAKRPDKARRRRRRVRAAARPTPCAVFPVPQLLHEAPHPTVRGDFLQFQSADVAKAERKGDGIRLSSDAALQRTQRLLQNAAVNLDPAVAEEDERRTLVQQKANLVRRDGLAGDADDELDARGGCGRGRRRLVRLDHG